MNCNLTLSEKPTFIIVSILNFGGAIFSLGSIFCIALTSLLDQSLRSILFSFSIANLIGTCLMMYDCIALYCFNQHFLDFAITITMTLSITHMYLLILSEYISLTAKQRARDNTGLLLVSWIIAITCGSVNVVAIGHSAKMVFLAVFVLALLLMLKAFRYVTEKHKKNALLMERYRDAFLRTKTTNKKVRDRSWRMKLLAVIVISYVLCSIPWVLNEVFEGNGPHYTRPFMHNIGLIVYSMQFYFPSCIAIYLRYIQRKLSGEWKVRSYRYRDSSVS